MKIEVEVDYLPPIMLDEFEWVSVRLPDGREVTVFHDKVYVTTEEQRLACQDGEKVWTA